MPAPTEPLIFLKAVSALNGPEGPIVRPEMSKRVEFEGELAIVLGKVCKNIQEEEARKVILGYTCFNDVTARDLQCRPRPPNVAYASAISKGLVSATPRVNDGTRSRLGSVRSMPISRARR